MDLLSGFKGRLGRFQPPIRGAAAGLLILALIASLTPVADTLWAEVLTVSGEVQTGEFEESPTPSDTETPTPTPSSTPTLTGPGQAGTTIEVQKIAASRWKEGAAGEVMIVYGRICVWNNGERFTEGLAIFDQVEIKPRQQSWQPLAGANQLIVPDQPIPPGENRCYDYEIEAPYQAQASYRNSVQVTILNHSGWLPGGPHCPGPLPCPFGPETRADFEPPAMGTETPTPTAEARRGLLPTQPSATLTTTPTLTPLPTATLEPTSPPHQPPPVQPSPTPPPSATPLPTLTPLPSDTPIPPTATPPPPTNTAPPTATPPPPTATPLPTDTPIPPTAPPPPPTDTPPVNPPPPGPPPIHEP
ncbi:MAG: hypothetical protein KatS3mg045_1518 [Bellilinea sp.]|nr:MAG: hypothetical protein KatS3mg045_1518 [Bellilinea sp.]